MRSLARVVLVTLVLVPTAAAKQPVSATVCGVSGCVTIDDPPSAIVAWGPDVLESPPRPGPFYRVEIEMSEFAPAWTAWYVPGGERSVATAGGAGRMAFARLGDDARVSFARITHGVDPFRAPVVTQALVDGRPAEDPASYLSLAGRPNEPEEPPIADDWITIELRADVESPWTGGVALLLSPSKGILQDGFTFSRLDRGTVERIVARRSLGSAARPSGPTSAAGGTIVPVLAGAVAAAVLAGAWRRRNRAVSRPA